MTYSPELTHLTWKLSERFPAFEVSEFGDVRRVRTRKRISGKMDRDCYIRYILRDADGVRVDIAAHRLVLETFIGPAPSPDHVIAHGNGSRLNCHYSNLRWATVQDNHDDRVFHGNSPSGERNPRAKITEQDVLDIRRDYRLIKQAGSIRSIGELDEKYGLCRSTIVRIATGESWSHVPMPDFSEMEAA